MGMEGDTREDPPVDRGDRTPGSSPDGPTLRLVGGDDRTDDRSGEELELRHSRRMEELARSLGLRWPTNRHPMPPAA